MYFEGHDLFIFLGKKLSVPTEIIQLIEHNSENVCVVRLKEYVFLIGQRGRENRLGLLQE